jgi:phosphate-selective porin OprO and OprP
MLYPFSDIATPPGSYSTSIRSLLLQVTLIALLLLVIPGITRGQKDTAKVVPDGTEGEVMVTADSLTQATQANQKKPWNQLDLGFTTLKFGAGFLYEYANYAQDEEGEKQSDSAKFDLGPDFKVRDFRVLLSGKFNTKRTFTWKAAFMYDGPTDEWFVRETGLMLGVPELWGHFFVGRTKEGFSLNKVMNGYAGWTMERQIAIDVIPILGDGIKWLGYLPKQKIVWNVGAYTDWLSKGQGFSTYEWQLAARVGWLPVYSPKDKKLVHLGINYRYGHPLDGEMRLRSRPEAFPAPYFIDTQVFPADHSNHVGYEAYYTSGPLMIGSEYYLHKFHADGKENHLFNGGEVGVSYILTGESRPYTTVGGIYSFVPVNRPVFKGGPGAIELVLRLSHLDLDDGTIKGGKFWRITPMANWYLSPNIRFELAYGYGMLDRFNMKGATHFFQSRIQFSIL